MMSLSSSSRESTACFFYSYNDGGNNQRHYQGGRLKTESNRNRFLFIKWSGINVYFDGDNGDINEN